MSIRSTIHPLRRSRSPEYKSKSLPTLCEMCSSIPQNIFCPGSRKSEFTYQHYSQIEVQNTLLASSKQGCQLCTILKSSLDLPKQHLPVYSIKIPVLPTRSFDESGITLHSFDPDHFIVRDNSRWSFVKFARGDTTNQKGDLLHDQANDKEVFAMIRKWANNCARTHPSCTLYRLNSTPGYVPARLVNVERTREGLRTKLVRRSDALEGSEYVALSHCWGNDPQLVPRSTMANIETHMKEIPWITLSKTFQEAIETTSELGKSYIWIDSLCIVQDNPKDLEVHCESMSEIYSNSFCTISATGALNGTQGLFIPRARVEMFPCVITPVVPPEPSSEPAIVSPIYAESENSSNDVRIRAEQSILMLEQRASFRYNMRPAVFTVLPTFGDWTNSMNGPLLTRGWTLQERELSVRVIHFTKDRVVWECREQYASEDDRSLTIKSMHTDKGLKFRLLDGNVLDRKARPYNYKFLKWTSLVEEYSRRGLSIRSDKLRAIAGLANAIRPIQQDDLYLSGLWKRDLIYELLWHAIPNFSNSPQIWPCPPMVNGIPTWSWAAYNGAVVFDRSQDGELTTGSASIDQAKSTWISLSGTLFPLSTSHATHATSDATMSKIYKFHHKDSEWPVYVDFDIEPTNVQCLDLFCLTLVNRSSNGTPQLSTKSPPSYAQSLASGTDQDFLQSIWDGVRSATGLVLLQAAPDIYAHSKDGFEQALHAYEPIAVFIRVGIFNAIGPSPLENKTKVTIV